MTYRHILTDLSDEVGTIRFNRPEVLNALDPLIIEETLDALDDFVDGKKARAIVLTGAGRAFCSGADIPGMAAKGAGTGDIHERYFNRLLLRLRGLPVPLVTLINGPAAGAGVGYALAGDIILAARSSYLLLPFVKLGLVPDVGATWFLGRAIGQARASALMMLGERLSADMAHKWGLVWRVEEDDALPAAGHEIARRLASGPTLAFPLMREGLVASATMSLPECLSMEARYQRQLNQTDDGAEGIAALRERRLPVFRGR